MCSRVQTRQPTRKSMSEVTPGSSKQLGFFHHCLLILLRLGLVHGNKLRTQSDGRNRIISQGLLITAYIYSYPENPGP